MKLKYPKKRVFILFKDLERMHVENVRSVIEDLEREYTILSDKLNEHEKQTDGK
jgi:hypothetical protein